MPVREFVDSSGVKWRVWNTRPSRGEMLSGEFEHGWLTFESATSLRRCTPIPSGWETASSEELEQMCHAATETRRVTPSTGRPVIADDDEGRAPDRDARR
jgi:hypothetical protein